MNRQLLQHASQQLAPCTDSPRAEAEWLLAPLLGGSRQQLAAGLLPAANAAQQQQFKALITRRANGEPLAYLLGDQPFRAYSFKVTPAVLIPRADTELLVDSALAFLRQHPGPARVLDACTGSGCVAISLALEQPSASVWGSDISSAALAIAAENSSTLVAPVQWLHADGLQLPAALERFHLIVANPPYIAEHDPHLPALSHEPTLALVSGPQGLDLLAALIQQAPAWLQAGGQLLLEHGYDQGPAVRRLLSEAGFSTVHTQRDAGGQERVSGGLWRV